ncbi:MAG: hypothetical protein ACJ768_08175 [Gaiellaceae bacterium]
MKWILLGATFAILLLFPQLLAPVAATIAALLSKPVLVAFGFGLAAGLRSPWLRRWAR